MDDEVGGDLDLPRGRAGLDDQFTSALLDGGDRGAQAKVDPETSRGIDDLSHEVGVEALQRTGAPVEDGHLCAGTGRDVGGLDCDVPTSDEGHPTGQRLERQEPTARREVLLVRCSSPGIPRGAWRAPAAMTTCLAT
jgi:hypothetical protein